MMHIHCPCGEVLVKSNAGEVKIRAKILVFKEDKAFAVCKSCGNENQVPVLVNNDLLKSMVESAELGKVNFSPVTLYVRTKSS